MEDSKKSLLLKGASAASTAMMIATGLMGCGDCETCDRNVRAETFIAIQNLVESLTRNDIQEMRDILLNGAHPSVEGIARFVLHLAGGTDRDLIMERRRHAEYLRLIGKILDVAEGVPGSVEEGGN